MTTFKYNKIKYGIEPPHPDLLDQVPSQTQERLCSASKKKRSFYVIVNMS